MAAIGARDPRVGTVLKNKWVLETRLGRGGVATVFAARHRNGNRVAIKILNKEVARSADVRARFLRESYASNAVNHPGVVRVTDDDVTDDGQPFLVMDLLEGELVDDRRMRRGGKLPLVEALRIGDAVLDVLAAAHENKIIHRDIKPENVFLCNDGTIKVLDFGFARMRQLAGEQTAAGKILGTPEFMSPEQANGIPEDVDELTDIWAVGATLFTILSGEPVHDAATTVSQILATVSQPARSLGVVAPDVPAAVIQVIDRALAYHKRDRWPDARSMQRALALAGQGVSTDTQPVPVPVPAPVPDSGAPEPEEEDATLAMRNAPVKLGVAESQPPDDAPTRVARRPPMTSKDAPTLPPPAPSEDERATTRLPVSVRSNPGALPPVTVPRPGLLPSGREFASPPPPSGMATATRSRWSPTVLALVGGGLLVSLVLAVVLLLVIR